MSGNDGYEYVTQNIGFEAPVPGKDAYDAVYYNGGVHFDLIFDGFDYVWLGDVNTSTPTPHIWFVSPTSGRAGDGVMIYGHGMGTSQATYSGAVDVLYEDTGWSSISVTSWAFVAATTDSYGPARMVSPSGLAINVEHVEIGVVIPSDAEAPGQQVRFRTDGP